MTMRNMIVFCNGLFSNPQDVKLGVSQGLLLALLLFLVYINDLPEYLTNRNVAMFADETPNNISRKHIYDLLIKFKIVLHEFSSRCQVRSAVYCRSWSDKTGLFLPYNWQTECLEPFSVTQQSVQFCKFWKYWRKLPS